MRVAPIKLVIFTIVALAACASASAQLKPEVQTGSLIPVKPEAVDKKSAGYMVKEFMHCVFVGNKVMAQRFLKYSDPVSSEKKK